MFGNSSRSGRPEPIGPYTLPDARGRGEKRKAKLTDGQLDQGDAEMGDIDVAGAQATTLTEVAVIDTAETAIQESTTASRRLTMFGPQIKASAQLYAAKELDARKMLLLPAEREWYRPLAGGITSTIQWVALPVIAAGEYVLNVEAFEIFGDDVLAKILAAAAGATMVAAAHVGGTNLRRTLDRPPRPTGGSATVVGGGGIDRSGRRIPFPTVPAVLTTAIPIALLGVIGVAELRKIYFEAIDRPDPESWLLAVQVFFVVVAALVAMATCDPVAEEQQRAIDERDQARAEFESDRATLDDLLAEEEQARRRARVAAGTAAATVRVQNLHGDRTVNNFLAGAETRVRPPTDETKTMPAITPLVVGAEPTGGAAAATAERPTMDLITTPHPVLIADQWLTWLIANPLQRPKLTLLNELEKILAPIETSDNARPAGEGVPGSQRSERSDPVQAPGGTTSDEPTRDESTTEWTDRDSEGAAAGSSSNGETP